MPVRRPSVPRRGLLLGALLLSLTACLPEIPLTTLAPKTSNAQAIFNLFEPIFWMGVIVFVVVEAVLFYSVFRFRTRDNSRGVPEQLHGNTALEIGWTIVPAVILSVIFYMTLVTLQEVHTPPANAKSAITAKVVGHQWWWEVQYPEFKTADGRPVSVGTDMHVPAGAVVNYTLETADVIHSFWVAQLGGKMDLIPGKLNKLFFVAPAKAGEFIGQCAELCGMQHANMRFHVMVDSDSDFQAWMKNQQASAGAPTGDKAKLGADLFTKAGCLACHNLAGAAPVTDGKIGPNLTHVGGRKSLAGGTILNSKEGLAKWLRNPDAVKPGNLMAGTMKGIVASWGADADKNIDALVEYLSGLK